MRLLASLPLALAAVVASTVPAAWAADPAPEAKTGLAVGSKAPAFTLRDQTGKERSLDEFLQRGKVAVVFYRSASW